MQRIGIIGSAGRRDEASLVSAERFQWMQDDLDQVVEDWGLSWSGGVHLVSGGAAFADHVAVAKALDYKCPLTLYLPCEWDAKKSQFVDTGERDFRSNPGGTSNYYHRQFSKSIGREAAFSLKQLGEAIAMPTTAVHVEQGFFARNGGLATNVDRLVAYTFGSGDKPLSPGTLRTWEACPSQKLHRGIPGS